MTIKNVITKRVKKRFKMYKSIFFMKTIKFALDLQIYSILFNIQKLKFVWVCHTKILCFYLECHICLKW